MNHTRRSIQLAGILLLCVLLSPATGLAATPKSYPLMCRGGGDYDFRVAPTGSDSGFSTQVSFRYKRSGGPATAGLEPGECAWMDRGLSDRGQKILVFTFEGVGLMTTLRRVDGRYASPIFQFIGSGNEVNTLLNKFISGGEFQVYAYYDAKQEALIVTKNGP